MTTIEKKVKLTYKLGLHMRPAERLVKLASGFDSRITMDCQSGVSVNAKSILGVLSLAARAGSILTFKAEGDDAEEAVEALVKLVESKFEGLEKSELFDG